MLLALDAYDSPNLIVCEVCMQYSSCLKLNKYILLKVSVDMLPSAVTVTPPTPQEVQRKLSVHTASRQKESIQMSYFIIRLLSERFNRLQTFHQDLFLGLNLIPILSSHPTLVHPPLVMDCSWALRRHSLRCLLLPNEGLIAGKTLRMRMMLMKEDGNWLMFRTLRADGLMNAYSKLDISGRKGRGERLTLSFLVLVVFFADVLLIIDMEETVVCPSTSPPCVLQEFKGVSTTPFARAIGHSLVYTS